MQTVVLVLVVVLSGFLVNKLADRYDFPVSDWVLWGALIGLGLLYELKEELPKQLAYLLGRASPEQLGNWIFWSMLTLVAGSIVALMVRSRCRLTPNRDQPQSATQQDNAAAHLREQLRNAVREYVATRRRESLHNKQLIDVQMKDMPDAIGKPPKPDLAPVQRMELKAIDERPGILNIRRILVRLAGLSSRQSDANLGEPLPPETSIISVFNREDIHRRLLILGEPGAGKTTCLLELAWGLAQQEEGPVPVIVDLASWQLGQSIPEWIQTQLPKTFANLNPQTVRGWLNTEALVLLLDGLDELGINNQIACTQALKTWLGDYPTQPVAICCRREEFAQMQEQSNLDLAELQGGAITLLALEEEEIRKYLKKLKRGFLWDEVIEHNQELHELAQRPFFLSILVEAYGEGETQRPIKNETELLERYVQRKLDLERWQPKHCRPDYQPPATAATRRYLAWLANQIEQNDQLFYIEQMQPHTLLKTSRQQWQYRLIVWLNVGLIGGLIIGLIIGLIAWLIIGLIGGLIGGLLGELDSIDLVEAFDLHFSRNVRKILFQNLIAWLNVGLIGGLIIGLIVELNVGLNVGLTGGLIIGLIKVLKQDLSFRAQPNQGIIASRNNVLILTPFMISAWIISFFLINFLLPGQNMTGLEIMIPGIGLGVLTSVYLGGGLTFIQHYTLRWVLASGPNPVVAWRYADFLSYASDRHILQQVGGGYRFIHDKLRIHLAKDLQKTDS